MPNRVRFYTRPGCSLCHRVVPILDRLAAEGLIEWEAINIEHDPNLLRQYADRIPVVEVEGRGALVGRVSEYRLRRLLGQGA
ncbi:MAG: glutaredoxin family protein [Ardenticatenia bacterium]|nr:glutaredoxin family protein [Ardenticatenia bacterium]